MATKNKIIVIGSGFSSLSASCYLAKAGYEVTLLEKNDTFGGRARQLQRDGFTFDIGPTFYWMPDVFERFFADFGKRPTDYYDLLQLDPGYEVYFGQGDSLSIAADFEETKALFESVEPGSGAKVQQFIDEAAENYKIAIEDLVYKPGENLMEIVTKDTVFSLHKFIATIKSQVCRYVKNEKLRKILEFPVLFLGAKPSNTPSFYNFMNYADFKLGTWHPRGGMYEVVRAMVALAKSLGVQMHSDSAVQRILTTDGVVTGVETSNATFDCDILLSGADYHHTETLLPKAYRQYSEQYWDKKTFAPSALLFYVGFDKKLDNLSHHTLFFDVDFDKHAQTIYDTQKWPDEPLFYASFPSKTDNNAAPAGKEAGIFLIPIAPDLEDTDALRKQYFDIIVERLEYLSQQPIRDAVLFSESYCVKDFKKDYNSYKGNAYGLANTLLQTHILRPKLRSKKLNNLFFAGQLTVPGPGVPPSLISGKIVTELITKQYGVFERNPQPVTI